MRRWSAVVPAGPAVDGAAHPTGLRVDASGAAPQGRDAAAAADGVPQAHPDGYGIPSSAAATSSGPGGSIW